MILNTNDYISEAIREINNEEYQIKVEKDLTCYHEQLINQCIDEMINNRNPDKRTGQLLRRKNSRTTIFYLLPKIHKPKNPGRPVISSVNSHTEKL